MRLFLLMIALLAGTGCENTRTGRATSDGGVSVEDAEADSLTDAEPEVDAEPIVHGLIYNDRIIGGVPFGERPEGLLPDLRDRAIVAYALQGCGRVYTPPYRGAADRIALAELDGPSFIEVPERPEDEDFTCAYVSRYEACGEMGNDLVCVARVTTYVKPYLIESIWLD